MNEAGNAAERTALSLTLTMTTHEPAFLDLTDPNNPCTARAFLGYKMDLKNGALIWKVCMDCTSKGVVEAEAQRLGLLVSHGLCTEHFQQRMSNLTGDRT